MPDQCGHSCKQGTGLLGNRLSRTATLAAGRRLFTDAASWRDNVPIVSWVGPDSSVNSANLIGDIAQGPVEAQLRRAAAGGYNKYGPKIQRPAASATVAPGDTAFLGRAPSLYRPGAFPVTRMPPMGFRP